MQDSGTCLTGRAFTDSVVGWIDFTHSYIFWLCLVIEAKCGHFVFVFFIDKYQGIFSWGVVGGGSDFQLLFLLDNNVRTP